MTKGMTEERALAILTLEANATDAEIETCYRSRRAAVIERNGPKDDEAIEQIESAFRYLMDRFALEAPSGAGPLEADEGSLLEQPSDSADEEAESGHGPNVNPLEYVERYFRSKNLEVYFDRSVRRTGVLKMASSPGEIEEYLSADKPSLSTIRDDILLRVKNQNVRLSIGDVQRAMRQYLDRRQTARKAEIVKKIEYKLDVDAIRQAEAVWNRLAGAALALDLDLAVAVLKHFVWQVKSKCLGRPVTHHLFPVICGEEQGSGKTCFVRAFISPLEELATDPVLLSELGRQDSADLYRFPVVFVDEVGGDADGAEVAALKTILTADAVLRPQPYTRLSVKIDQNATFIGTSNHLDIQVVVKDDTGHRRFAMLPFRSGNPVKGGDQSIWEIISKTDYLLLWRSVDTFADSPIKPQLGALHAWQQRHRQRDPLLDWFINLDYATEEVRAIHKRDGFASEALFKLFCEQTGSSMSTKRFGQLMTKFAADPNTPVRSKRASNAMMYWRDRPPKA